MRWLALLLCACSYETTTIEQRIVTSGDASTPDAPEVVPDGAVSTKDVTSDTPMVDAALSDTSTVCAWPDGYDDAGSCIGTCTYVADVDGCPFKEVQCSGAPSYPYDWNVPGGKLPPQCTLNHQNSNGSILWWCCGK